MLIITVYFVIFVFCNATVYFVIFVSFSRSSVYIFTQMVEHCVLSCSTPALTLVYSFIMEVSERQYFSTTTQNFILCICCNLYNLSLTDWHLVTDLCDFQGLLWWFRWLSVCLQCRRPGFDPWVRKIPWRRKWQPTPVLLPGKFHGQRSLVG